MLPVSALKSMRVMFATPCYISAVSMNYVASIFSLSLDCAHVGLPCILHLHSESLITRGRNKMVIKFLSEDFTHLFWIDSDIVFGSQSVFRLLLADRDVAAGVYPMKNFKWPAEGLPAGMTQKQFENTMANTRSIRSITERAASVDMSIVRASSRSPKRRPVSW